MKKTHLLLAVAAITLASCANDDYVGEEQQGTSATPGIIAFSAGSNATTRADLTGEDAATKLANKFFTYGVKTVGGAESVVFPTYTVAYKGTANAGAAGSTDSNTKGWEYVGLTGFDSQTIHYWDYSATNYTFQAWSLTDGGATVEAKTKNSLEVKGTADDLSKLYIADLVSIDKSTSTTGTNTYGGVVTFTFRNGATKVRFGMYETIPGYKLSKVTFRSKANKFTDSNSNALLDGTFNGQGATSGTYTVTYGADGHVKLDNTATVAAADHLDFGTFDQGNISEDGANPTYAGGGYQIVLPNEDNNADMTLYIDFTLTADNGTDVINVKGASVTVPAASMKWLPNYAYTYLFKVTKDMNGTTGQEGTDPTKLYPITFDATVVDEAVVNPTVETEVK